MSLLMKKSLRVILVLLLIGAMLFTTACNEGAKEGESKKGSSLWNLLTPAFGSLSGSGSGSDSHACSYCNGAGATLCSLCSGVGQNTCYTCSGTGRIYSYPSYTLCYSCGGLGRNQCTLCAGRGRLDCPLC